MRTWYRPRHRQRRWLPTVVASFGLLAGGGILISCAATSTTQVPPPAAQTLPKSVSSKPPASMTPSMAPNGVMPLARSVPETIVIPSIKVNAPVEPVGLDSSGAIITPPLEDHNLAAWYDGGVTPGQTGTSIIIGHVDSYQGISVFYYLKDLVKGDKVDVTLKDGKTAVFSVTQVQVISKASFPESVYASQGIPELRLITCGGPFDSSTGHYIDNIIVYANLD